jgi:hypothetical protein
MTSTRNDGVSKMETQMVHGWVPSKNGQIENDVQDIANSADNGGY